MNLQISTGSNELDNFYKKEFNFSYSSINKLLFSPRMFYNHYVLKEKEDSTDSHLVIGRVLHCLLLEPLNFDNQFAVMTSKIPSENNKKIIDNIFKNYLVNQNNTLTLEDYSKDILTHLLTINLHQSLKTDQQRLDKILTDENNEYFEFLKLSLGKTVIDQIILDNCKKSFFGVSKSYADLLVQEFNKNYFNLKKIIINHYLFYMIHYSIISIVDSLDILMKIIHLILYLFIQIIMLTFL